MVFSWLYMFWARKKDLMSLRNMVELLASAGQSKGFSRKKKDARECQGRGESYSTLPHASWSYL